MIELYAIFKLNLVVLRDTDTSAASVERDVTLPRLSILLSRHSLNWSGLHMCVRMSCLLIWMKHSWSLHHDPLDSANHAIIGRLRWVSNEVRTKHSMFGYWLA